MEAITEVLKGLMENMVFYLFVWIGGSLLLTGVIVLMLSILRVPQLIAKPIWVVAFGALLYFGYFEFFMPGITG